MFEELPRLFFVDRLPLEGRHGTELLGLHLVSDGLLTLAFLAIPIALFYLIYRRRDLEYRWVLALFGAFILFLATVHATAILNLLRPDYWLQGSAKAVTAGFALSAAVTLWVLMPRLLSLPSPMQLRRVNAALTREGWERQQQTRALEKSEKRFRESFEKSPVPTGLVSPSGRWLRANRALCEFLGSTEKALLATDIQSVTHPEDLKSDLARMRELLDKKQSGYQIEKRWLCPDKAEQWTLANVSVVWEPDGKKCHFVYQVQDIGRWLEALDQLQTVRRERDEELLAHAETEDRLEQERAKREAAEQLLRQYVDHLEQTHDYLDAVDRRIQQLPVDDTLTRLPNAHYFESLAQRTLAAARRYDAALCLLLVTPISSPPDPRIALIALAPILKQQLRESDVFGHWNGAFGLLLTQATLTEAKSVAARLRNAAQAMEISNDSGEPVKLDCHIGIAQWEPGYSLETLLEIAEKTSNPLGDEAKPATATLPSTPDQPAERP